MWHTDIHFLETLPSFLPSKKSFCPRQPCGSESGLKSQFLVLGQLRDLIWTVWSPRHWENSPVCLCGARSEWDAFLTFLHLYLTPTPSWRCCQKSHIANYGNSLKEPGKVPTVWVRMDTSEFPLFLPQVRAQRRSRTILYFIILFWKILRSGTFS